MYGKIHPEAFTIWTDTLISHGYRLSRKGQTAKRKVDKNTTHEVDIAASIWPGGEYRVQPAAMFCFWPATRLLAEHVPNLDPKVPLIAPGFYNMASSSLQVHPFANGEEENDVELMIKLSAHYTQSVDPWFWSLSDPETLVREVVLKNHVKVTGFYSATASAVVFSRWDLVEELLAGAEDILAESEKVNPNPVLRNWIAYLEKLC